MHERHRHQAAAPVVNRPFADQLGEERLGPVSLRVHHVHQDQLLAWDDLLDDDGGDQAAGESDIHLLMVRAAAATPSRPIAYRGVRLSFSRGPVWQLDCPQSLSGR